MPYAHEGCYDATILTQKERNRMSTYVLIHGAWHGGWCWRKVVPLLESKGHTVVAPDLPGHGDDRTPPATVTLADYADRICAVARAQKEPVILLGHSMGGVAITQVAEDCPESVRALVYTCAFLPRNGDSLAAWAQQDAESLVGPNIVPVAEGVLDIRREAVHNAFYGECSQEDEAFAAQHLTLQGAAPLATPVATSVERWGRIPRYYIECTKDRAIPITTQREMQKHSPCRKTFSIDTDHSPFFSAPGALADALLEIGAL
ncbi:MAG: alpha/beta fold hydrolase [Terracidiphilus sp.]